MTAPTPLDLARGRQGPDVSHTPRRKRSRRGRRGGKAKHETQPQPSQERRPTCARDGCSQTGNYPFCSRLCQELHIELLVTERFIRDTAHPELDHAEVWSELVDAADAVTRVREKRRRITRRLKRRGALPPGPRRYDRDALLVSDLEARGLGGGRYTPTTSLPPGAG